MNGTAKVKNIFKWISFGLLIVIVTTTLLSMGWQTLTDKLVQADILSGDVLAEEGIDKITDKIYSINGLLCGLSIISGCAYLVLLYLVKPSNDTYSYSKKTKKVKEKFDVKSWAKRWWPCFVLILFMLWTAVGCIQASTEAAAENFLRQYDERVQEIQEDILTSSSKEAEAAKRELQELNKLYEKNKEIADWSNTDRMSNAADRGWNGCDNLKDGYWSFLFYSMVVVNVIMLGANADNLKKWILRVLLISGLILIFISFCTLLDPVFFGGSIKAHRAIFNNSNHYGYYLCIITMLCATTFVKDKNISLKIISLLGFVMASFMLIVNNTFGSYLGVATALGLLFVFFIVGIIILTIKLGIFKYNKKDATSIQKKLFDNLKDFIKLCVIVLIFAFFSNTITGAESKIYLENNYICQKSYIGTTFGERNVLSKNSGYKAVIIESDFEISGDNRVYNQIKKTLELVKADEALEPNAKIHILNGNKYEAVKEEKSTYVKTPEEYSNTTIVENNFEQLFKDIAIIFSNIDKENDNENISKGNNVSGEILSGEVLSGEVLSGESVSEKDLEEDINEKSGLSEAVSNTGSGRGEVWIKSLDLMEQRPLFGWGLENLLNEFYTQYGINEGRTHNLILQLAGTTGIIGMLLYISAVAVIFFKVLFNFKFINYNIKTRAILFGVSIIVGIFVYVLMQRLLGVLLFSVIAAVFISIVVFLITNVRNVKLRISQWGLIEYITMPTFIAYMISSLFGNSAFYTSPYFMVILGMMIATILYKGNEPVSAEENDEKIEESEEENDEKIEESEEEKKYREKINNLSKDEKEKLINKYKILDIICIALFFCSSVILFNNILINIFNIGLKLVSTIIILRLLFKKKKYIENSAYLYKSVNKLGYLISIIEILINSSQMLFIIINGINILKPPSICIKVCVNIIMIVSLLLNLYSIKKIVDKNSKKVHDESINIKKN